jgi:hypothetical protein
MRTIRPVARAATSDRVNVVPEDVAKDLEDSWDFIQSNEDMSMEGEFGSKAERVRFVKEAKTWAEQHSPRLYFRLSPVRELEPNKCVYTIRLYTQADADRSQKIRDDIASGKRKKPGRAPKPTAKP